MDSASKKRLLDRALATSEEIIENKENAENIGSTVNTFYGSSNGRSSPIFGPRPRTYSRGRPGLSTQSNKPLSSPSFSSPDCSPIPLKKSRSSELVESLIKDTSLWVENKSLSRDDARPRFSLQPRKSLSKQPRRLLYDESTNLTKSPSFKDSDLIGFPNTGLTCYVNAVLQSLLGHPSFLNDILHTDVESSQRDDESNVDCKDPNLVQLLFSIAKHKNDGQQSKVIDAIRSFRVKLDKAIPRFDGIHMQDAHEFLVFFCEYIQTQTKMLKARPIEDNLAFQLLETRTCCRCGHSTTKLKDDLFLRLDVPEMVGDKKHTLQALVEKTLDGCGMEIRCSKCNHEGDNTTANAHESKDAFTKLPRILVLYLPRSQYFTEAKEFRKNRAHINVNVVISLANYVTPSVDCAKLSAPQLSLLAKRNTPSKVKLQPPSARQVSLSAEELSKLSEEDQIKLALEQSLTDDNNLTDDTYMEDVVISGKTEAIDEFDYKLSASITHVNSIDSVESGHYVADVFSVSKKQWLHYDDMKVTPRSVEDVVKQGNVDGCLFFFTHRDIVC